MEPRNTIDSEALLQEVGWVRALARRLVSDVHAAEDLAQDAMVVGVVALRGTQQPRVLRQWLGGVVRNLGRNARRRDEARGRREGPLPEDPVLPSTLELVERASTQRELVGVLLELDELDREVLLLHHFEGASNEAIAQRQGVPASTVASRLARAHQRLRTKWIARHGGDERGGLAALVLLAQAPAGAPPVPTAAAAREALASSPRLSVLAAPILLAASVVVGALWWSPGGQERAVVPTAPRTTASGEPASIEAGARTPASALADLRQFVAQERRPIGAVAPTAKPAVCPAPIARPITTRGRVLDLEGQPVAGVEVCRMAPLVEAPESVTTVFNGHAGLPTGARATTDAEGAFTLEVPRIGWFQVVSSGWATLLTPELTVVGGDEALVVAAPSLPLDGHLVDPAGQPVAGVRLRLAVSAQRLYPLGPVLEGVMEVEHRATTDASGAFAFEKVPGGELLLHGHAEGFEGLIETLEPRVRAGGDAYESLLLELVPSAAPFVTGTVRDLGGAPVAEASVSLGQRIVRTAADGTYHVSRSLPWGVDPGPVVLRALHVDHGSAQREVELPAPGAPPLVVDLVLDEPRLALQGRVIDPEGAPVSGVQVYVLEETPFGMIEMGQGFRWGSLEALSGAFPSTTRADGRFRIEGLGAQPYRVQAFDARSLLTSTSVPRLPGGADVTLVFDRAASTPVAGRLVDRQGHPVAGAKVSLSSQEWWAGPGDHETGLSIGNSAVTDAEGRFRIEEAAPDGFFLRLEGDPIVPELFRRIEGEPDRSALELPVSRRAYLQLRRPAGAPPARRLHVEALDGTQLPLMDLRGMGVTPLQTMPVSDGLNPAIVVPEEGLFAVLTDQEGQEVARTRFEPVVGEVIEVEL